MTDIALAWNPADGVAEWQVANGLLVGGSDLETAVIVSLFSDGRLPADQSPPDGSTDRRGWWADTYREMPLGSLLWTLERRAISNRTALLAEAKSICTDALGWLVSDGVAASVQVTTLWLTPTTLGIAITITAPTGTVSQYRYAWAWQGVS